MDFINIIQVTDQWPENNEIILDNLGGPNHESLEAENFLQRAAERCGRGSQRGAKQKDFSHCC